MYDVYYGRAGERVKDAVRESLRWIPFDRFPPYGGFAVLLRQNRRVGVFLPRACRGKSISDSLTAKYRYQEVDHGDAFPSEGKA